MLLIFDPKAIASMSLRGFGNNDLSIISTEGSTLYRPDGSDSTLVCYSSFSPKKDDAYRIVDLSGSDDFAATLGLLRYIGNQINVEECKFPGDTVEDNRVKSCLDKLDQTSLGVVDSKDNKSKRIVEKVNYKDECGRPAKPKNASLFQQPAVTQKPKKKDDDVVAVTVSANGAVRRAM